jgi:acetyl-CoA carboxylase carboxyltransferase component
LEIDAVIDPADTRRWLMAGLQTQPSVPIGPALAIDTW